MADMIAENEYFYTEIDGEKYRGQIVTSVIGLFAPRTAYLNIWKNYKKTYFGLSYKCDWSYKTYVGQIFDGDLTGNNIEYLDGIFWFDATFVKSLFPIAINMYNRELEYDQEQEYKKSNIGHAKNI